MAAHVGQSFMIGFEGTETTPELRSFIRDEVIGGVILFARNIASKQQLIRLIGRLQDEAAEPPLLVGIDQEGGTVQRLPASFGSFPSMAEIGRRVADRDDPALARAAGEELAAVLLPLGVNMDFAPVLDVNTNPFNPIIGDRAFGSDPAFVAACGVEFMKGLMGGGVLACGKHFPGHGDTDVDSHAALPLLNHTRTRFEVCEWVPFRAAIEAGIPALMTAHVLAPNLDCRPASVSHRITSRVLRGDLNFPGAVFSDDLLMDGIAHSMPPRESAPAAIAAGADVALICRDMAAQRAALDAVKRAVGEGGIPHQRIQASCARLSNLKQRLC